MSYSPDDTLVLRPRIASADEMLRPTRAEIDLAALRHNLGEVTRTAGGARVLAMVKADAYGHGVVPVARALESAGVFGFGVALAEEALELREAGIRGSILVMNGVHGGAHAAIVEAGLTPVIYEEAEARAFSDVARGRPVGIHLKVDTGMSRLGVPFRVLERFLDRIDGLALRIDGVMTHLASADEPTTQTEAQLARFDDALRAIRARGHAPTVLHAANSAATFRHPRARFDMVRVGIALFGYAGADDVRADLRPTMRLRSRVISLRTLEPGDAVGYGATFVAQRPMRVAAVPMGYGDGYMRALSNRATVLVRGVRCPIVGNVSMDLVSVDVSALTDARIGDEVVLLGAAGGDVITPMELAALAGTIPYEILTNVSRRVPRVYLDGGG